MIEHKEMQYILRYTEKNCKIINRLNLVLENLLLFFFPIFKFTNNLFQYFFIALSWYWSTLFWTWHKINLQSFLVLITNDLIKFMYLNINFCSMYLTNALHSLQNYNLLSALLIAESAEPILHNNIVNGLQNSLITEV